MPFDSLFEHANDAIALVEFQGDTPVIEAANPVFHELFAPPGAEVIRQDLDEVVTSGDRTGQARDITRRAKEGNLVSQEVTRDTVDGPREFLWQLVPVEDDGDAIERAFAIYNDITDRDREQERYRAFIERSTDIITVLDSDGTYQYQSPSSERIVGYDPSELIGTIAFEYIHPDDRQQVMETFYEAVENPSRDPTAEYRFQHPDGSWLWLESRGNNQLDNPAIEGFVVNSRDITERKEFEQELSEVRERMEFALESTDALVWDWNVDEDRATFYPSEQGLYGATVESWDDFIELVHSGDRAAVRESIEEALETGEPKHEEIRIRHNGEVRWIDAPGQPVVDDDGTTRIIGVARDITDRKRSELELERQNERLDEFASVVSHDLRNPLNVAQGQLELAREDPNGEHLDAVARAHERMQTLIDDMLSLARAGEPIGETDSVKLARLVETCWQNVETESATLVIETDTIVQADKTRLQQLFENLLRNAIDHGGANVTVTIGDLPDGFYVEDDGPGIPEDERGKILEPGYTTSDTGTGFGMSIVREIAQAHGWDIHIATGTDGGTRFEFSR